jgi:multiple sugar transport system substrate-binding protein
MRKVPAILASAAALCMATTAMADQPFNWKKYDGETINFLSSNHPWPNGLAPYLPEFTQLTGIKINIDTYNENQMRQRLTTLMQAGSSAVDVMMTLPVREGRLFATAGYYKDIKPLLDDPTMTPPDYDYADFSPAIVSSSRIKGITIGIPLNIEGPVLSYRMDVLAACHLQLPATLEDLMTTAAALKKCRPDMVPFSARGQKEGSYFTFGPMFYNFGGSFARRTDGKWLCNAPGIKAAQFYADLLGDYGPPGVNNYTFYQTSELMGQGRAAMTFESSNEYATVTSHEGRTEDVGVALLPPGRDTHVQIPTVIGWHVGIPAVSKKVGPAWYFILWATSKDMEGRLALKGIAPPRVSVFQGAAFQTWANAAPGRRQWLDTLLAMATKGTGIIGFPSNRAPEMNTVVGEAVSRVMLHEVDAKTAACEAETKINDLLAE